MSENENAAQKTSYYSVRRVRGSLIYLSLGRVFTAIASLFTVFIVVRLLSVEAYAEFATYIGLSLTVALLSAGGLDRILPKFLPFLKEKGAERELKSWSFRLLFVRITILALVFVPIVAFEATLRDWLSLSDITLAVTGFLVYSAIQNICIFIMLNLQALLRQRETMIGLSIQSYSRVLMLFLVWVLEIDVGVGEIMVIYAISVCCELAYTLPVLWITLNRHSNLSEAKAPMLQGKQIWRLAWPNYLNSLLLIALSPGIIRLVGAHYLPIAEVAALGFALSVYGITYRFSPGQFLMGIIEPSLNAKHARDGRFQTVSEHAATVIKMSCFILFPAVAWLFFSGEPLINLVSSGKFGHITWVLAVFTFMVVLDTINQMLLVQVNVTGRGHILVEAGLLVNLLMLIPFVGLLTVGLPGLVFGLILVKFFRLSYVHFRLGTTGHTPVLPWGSYARMAAFGALSAWLASEASVYFQQGLVAATAAAVLTGLVYLGLCFFWKPFGGPERALINRSIGRPLFVW